MAKDKNTTTMIVVGVIVVLVLGYFLLSGGEEPAPAVVEEPSEPAVPSAPAADDAQVVKSKSTATLAPEDTVVISPKRQAALDAGCIDSDGGFNVYEQGDLMDARGSTKRDECSHSDIYVNRLYEYHCGDDGGYVRTTYECENGCDGVGACLE